MSTLKVSEIRNASSATGGLSIAADGVVSGALPYPNRNLLYNGAMQVAQRGTSASITTSTGYYTADRWRTAFAALGAWTQSIEADGPSGSGFTKSLKMLCTTADASPAATDLAALQQMLEGQDLQRIAKGTTSAQQLTLSFWVKSNVTGTYVVNLQDTDNTRMVSGSYTISSANTWEQKSITFAADTTGTLDNDNANSMTVAWWLGAGSNFTTGTLQTSWTSTVTADYAVGQTNLAAATNNYWQITGVQLEVGDTATEFEHLPFGVELARCQRYYYRNSPGVVSQVLGTGWNVNATVMRSVTTFPVTMRSAPTALDTTGTASDYSVAHTGPDTTCSSVPTFVSANTTYGQANFIVSSGLTSGQGAAGRTQTTSSYLGWTAEL